MLSTSGYNLRPRKGTKVESRPTIKMKTQQGGPVQNSKSREKHYRPNIEEQASQAESQSDLHMCDSMITKSIGKAISAATVRRRLLRIDPGNICVPLSVQSRGARLKWCWEHGNRTVSEWAYVMFTDE
ncbi:hypothetical protein TNCV_2488351 [Trichonephila clavipes]|nr:hypothetical protein TNCV_2488351 [Trichonephila clavipes]